MKRINTSTLLENGKKNKEHESDDCTNCDWCLLKSDLRITKETEELGGWRTEETIQTTALLRDGQNTVMSHGDLRRLAVTQTVVKNHQLTLM